MSYLCPVCGYNELEEPPYNEKGNPSYEVCPCCGFEFGFDDESEGLSFAEYREKWLEDGAEWLAPKKRPNQWEVEKQLERIGVKRGGKG